MKKKQLVVVALLVVIGIIAWQKCSKEISAHNSGSSATVYVLQKGTSYHKSDCYHIEGKKTTSYTKREVEGLGYTPCGTCFSSTRVTERDDEAGYKNISKITVDSSAISEIGYDEKKQLLFIRFRDSGVAYIYEDVPSSVWKAFKGASSLGSYFNKSIKGQYESIRLE